jgi:hypothetical protein
MVRLLPNTHRLGPHVVSEQHADHMFDLTLVKIDEIVIFPPSLKMTTCVHRYSLGSALESSNRRYIMRCLVKENKATARLTEKKS